MGSKVGVAAMLGPANLHILCDFVKFVGFQWNLVGVNYNWSRQRWRSFWGHRRSNYAHFFKFVGFQRNLVDGHYIWSRQKWRLFWGQLRLNLHNLCNFQIPSTMALYKWFPWSRGYNVCALRKWMSSFYIKIKIMFLTFGMLFLRTSRTELPCNL